MVVKEIREYLENMGSCGVGRANALSARGRRVVAGEGGVAVGVKDAILTCLLSQDADFH
jgi:hypothetical protein